MKQKKIRKDMKRKIENTFKLAMAFLLVFLTVLGGKTSTKTTIIKAEKIEFNANKKEDKSDVESGFLSSIDMLIDILENDGDATNEGTGEDKKTEITKSDEEEDAEEGKSDSSGNATNKNNTEYTSTSVNQVYKAKGIASTVIKYKSQFEEAAKNNGIENYVDVLLAICNQESHGSGNDIMQCSASSPEESIKTGTRIFSERLKKADNDLDIALQAYNFGGAFIIYAKNHGGYSKENADEFAKIHSKGVQHEAGNPLGKWKYGDQNYVEHVKKYLDISGDGSSSNLSSNNNSTTGNMSEYANIMKYIYWKYTQDDAYKTTINFPSLLDVNSSGSYGGTYVVKIDSSNALPALTKEQLKKALKNGYSTNSKLLNNLDAFYEMQEKYKVNAVFAAAVSIKETTAGTAGHAKCCKNWFNYQPISGMTKGDSRWAKWSSDAEGIMGFGELISTSQNYYFKKGEITVEDISKHYCPPGDGWAKFVKQYMKKLYKAAGVDISEYVSASNNESSSNSGSKASNEIAQKVIDIARNQLGKPYIWGATGPNSFDCSGLVQYCCKRAGVKKMPPRTTSSYPATFGSKYKVSLNDLEPGDILWRHSSTGGHVGIYIGKGKFIHAPKRNDVVKITSVKGYGAFMWAYRPWK